MKAFGITDKGSVRWNNQDAFRFQLLSEGKTAVAVLCDGMGGASSGEIASALATEAYSAYVTEALKDRQDRSLTDIGREAAAFANVQVYDRAIRDEACRGMGTTLVSVLSEENETAVINIGDSRCYWIADGLIQQITRDHSFVQDMVDKGLLTEGEARSHPRKNLITRAVGTDRGTRSDVFRIDLQSGDRLLLCSDGLSNVLPEAEILATVQENAEPEAACRALLHLALERGAPDNVTVLLLQN